MSNEQKERLESELRFLKESLEADVISKDEYKKGKERIERKLKEIEEKLKETKIEEPEEQPLKEYIREEEEPEEEEKPLLEEKEEPEEEIKISRKWIYWGVILIIAVILVFSIRSCYNSNNKNETQNLDELKGEVNPICSSNSDCEKEGMVGICINPDTNEANCEFKEDVNVSLLVINDKNCLICDSARMENTLKKIFPNMEITRFDYITSEGKKLVDDFNINALPSYIFDSKVGEAINFNDFKRALINKKDYYLITNSASGANYYFKREEIQNKLDIFLTADKKNMVDNNTKEFLDIFSEKISFEKHIVTEKEKMQLKEELGITSYPSFLINNQLKFGGVQSADSLKQKFCQSNNLPECEKELKKSVV